MKFDDNDFVSHSFLQYTQGLLHSIQNADGTVSIIQVDPSNQIITLPDGTTAQVQGIATVSVYLFLEIKTTTTTGFYCVVVHQN